MRSLTRAKRTVGPLLVALFFLSVGCSSPTAPDIVNNTPGVPGTPETPQIPQTPPGGGSGSATTWDDFDQLLSNPFYLELTGFLDDPEAGAQVREALESCVAAVAGRDSGVLASALDRLAAAIAAYGDSGLASDNDRIMLEVILNAIDLAHEWLALGSLSVAPSSEISAGPSPTGAPQTPEDRTE